MNYIQFSPHFPPNYYLFAANLRRKGVNVLGLGDAPYDYLRPELRGALGEYYRVANCHNYDELLRAVGYFTHRHGKIDRYESHNEYWLETDARLRTDFNIPGLRVHQLAAIKRKSEMKAKYAEAGIPTALGRVARSVDEGLALAAETGYPLVAKPDIGVGANQTYRLDNQAALLAFFATKPGVDYFLEEFIQGRIETFDGLVDQDGQIVFSSAMQYSDGVMEQVNERLDFCYWTVREIPADLAEAGEALVYAYDLRERFFHFEFFRLPDGGLMGLEVNMRPPGGLTTDMWNYANDFDVYCEYANVVTENRVYQQPSRAYACMYIGRRSGRAYRHTVEEARAAFPGRVMHHEAISGVFASAIGDYGILLCSPAVEELHEVAEYLLAK